MTKLEDVQAYPLAWPDGWPRTPVARREDGARFKSGDAFSGAGDQRRYVGKRMITFDRARRLLRDELDRLKAQNVVLSTNARVRADGEARSDDAERRLSDPGIAVYFRIKGKPMVMAQDAFDSLAANTRSLGLAIEAMRQLERHGGGTMMERAFAGFTALPAPEGSTPKRPWWIVLNYSADADDRADLSVDEVRARYKTLAKRRHPDSDGGSHELMSELNQALEDAVLDLP